MPIYSSLYVSLCLCTSHAPLHVPRFSCVTSMSPFVPSFVTPCCLLCPLLCLSCLLLCAPMSLLYTYVHSCLKLCFLCTHLNALCLLLCPQYSPMFQPAPYVPNMPPTLCALLYPSVFPPASLTCSPYLVQYPPISLISPPMSLTCPFFPFLCPPMPNNS